MYLFPAPPCLSPTQIINANLMSFCLQLGLFFVYHLEMVGCKETLSYVNAFSLYVYLLKLLFGIIFAFLTLLCQLYFGMLCDGIGEVL